MIEYIDMLKIGCGLYEVHIMTQAISEFMKLRSDVELNYLQYGYSSIVSYVSTNVVDIAVVLDTCLDSMERKLTKKPLYEDTWAVSAHKENPFWQMSAEDKAKLKNQMVITMVNNEFEIPYARFASTAAMTDLTFTYTNSFEPTIALLMANAGITLLPQSLRPCVPSIIRIENVFAEPMKHTFYAVYNANSDNNSLPVFVSCCDRLFGSVDSPE